MLCIQVEGSLAAEVWFTGGERRRCSGKAAAASAAARTLKQVPFAYAPLLGWSPPAAEINCSWLWRTLEDVLQVQAWKHLQ